MSNRAGTFLFTACVEKSEKLVHRDLVVGGASQPLHQVFARNFVQSDQVTLDVADGRARALGVCLALFVRQTKKVVSEFHGSCVPKW